MGRLISLITAILITLGCAQPRSVPLPPLFHVEMVEGGTPGTTLQHVTAPAHFMKSDRDNDTYLIVNDGKQRICILWSYAFRDRNGHDRVIHYFPVNLTPGTTYKFALEYERRMNRNEITTPDKPSLFAQYNLVRVTSARDGAVLFDREICEVHQRRMSLTEVPVIYGLVEFSGPRPTREQWMKEFPHYQDYELGGCVVRSEKTASIYVCPDCVVAYNRWIEAKSKEANAVKASAD